VHPKKGVNFISLRLLHFLKLIFSLDGNNMGCPSVSPAAVTVAVMELEIAVCRVRTIVLAAAAPGADRESYWQPDGRLLW